MPNYYNPYQPNYPMGNYPQQPQPQPQVQPQIQNGGLVFAPSEAYARNYSVAPGNSVLFKDESAPYMYSKTMGFSQLDQPIFKRFRLVEEESEGTVNVPVKEEIDIRPIHKAIDLIKEDIDQIWAEIEDMKNVPKKAPTKSKTENRGDD